MNGLPSLLDSVLPEGQHTAYIYFSAKHSRVVHRCGCYIGEATYIRNRIFYRDNHDLTRRKPTHIKCSACFDISRKKS